MRVIILPKNIVSDDVRVFRRAGYCLDAFLCGVLGRISVVGCRNRIAVGGNQSEARFAFLIREDNPLGAFLLDDPLKRLVFDGGGGGVVDNALNTSLA